MPVAQSWQARRAEHLHVLQPRLSYTSCTSSAGKGCFASPYIIANAAGWTAMSALSRYGLADVATSRFLARKALRQLTWALSQEHVPSFRCLSSAMTMDTGCIVLGNPWLAGVLGATAVHPRPLSVMLLTHVELAPATCARPGKPTAREKPRHTRLNVQVQARPGSRLEASKSCAILQGVLSPERHRHRPASTRSLS